MPVIMTLWEHPFCSKCGGIMVILYTKLHSTKLGDSNNGSFQWIWTIFNCNKMSVDICGNVTNYLNSKLCFAFLILKAPNAHHKTNKYDSS